MVHMQQSHVQSVAPAGHLAGLLVGAYLGFGLSPVRLPAPRKKNGGAPAASAATSGSESEGEEVTDVMHVDHGNPVKRQAFRIKLCNMDGCLGGYAVLLAAPLWQSFATYWHANMWHTCWPMNVCGSTGGSQVGRLRQLCHHAGAHGGGHGCVQNRRAAAHQGPGAAGLLGLACLKQTISWSTQHLGRSRGRCTF